MHEIMFIFSFAYFSYSILEALHYSGILTLMIVGTILGIFINNMTQRGVWMVQSIRTSQGLNKFDFLIYRKFYRSCYVFLCRIIMFPQ